MMAPSTEKRRQSQHISRVNFAKAEFASRYHSNHTILVERLVRQGISRQIAEGFARHLDRQAVHDA